MAILPHLSTDDAATVLPLPPLLLALLGPWRDPLLAWRWTRRRIGVFHVWCRDQQCNILESMLASALVRNGGLTQRAGNDDGAGPVCRPHRRATRWCHY